MYFCFLFFFCFLSFFSSIIDLRCGLQGSTCSGKLNRIVAGCECGLRENLRPVPTRQHHFGRHQVSIKKECYACYYGVLYVYIHMYEKHKKRGGGTLDQSSGYKWYNVLRWWRRHLKGIGDIAGSNSDGAMSCFWILDLCTYFYIVL